MREASRSEEKREREEDIIRQTSALSACGQRKRHAGQRKDESAQTERERSGGRERDQAERSHAEELKVSPKLSDGKDHAPLSEGFGTICRARMSTLRMEVNDPGFLRKFSLSESPLHLRSGG